MNPKLLQQLMLAKEAGSNRMAKDFFAKTPGTGGPEEGAPGAPPMDGKPGAMPPSAAPGSMPPTAAPGADGEAPGDEMKPEDLEELLRLLQSQGGGQQQGQ